MQTHSVTLMIPLNYFVVEVDSGTEMQTSSYEDDSKYVLFITEQISDTWINVIRLFIIKLFFELNFLKCFNKLSRIMLCTF